MDRNLQHPDNKCTIHVNEVELGKFKLSTGDLFISYDRCCYILDIELSRPDGEYIHLNCIVPQLDVREKQFTFKAKVLLYLLEDKTCKIIHAKKVS